jgi:hypothetical protein
MWIKMVKAISPRITGWHQFNIHQALPHHGYRSFLVIRLLFFFPLAIHAYRLMIVDRQNSLIFRAK